MKSNAMFTLGALAALLAAGALAEARAAETSAAPAERGWGITLENFFGVVKNNQERPLYIYARSQQNQWVGAVGSSRKKYNAAYYVADLSGVQLDADRLHGRAYLMIVPDPWVPRDHRPVEIEIDLDAKVTDEGPRGQYKVVSVSREDESLATLVKAGNITGDVEQGQPLALPDKLTLSLVLQNALVGGDPADAQRRMLVKVGLDHGKVVGAKVAQISIQHVPFDETPFAMDPDAVQISAHGLTARFDVPYWTRAGEAATYHFDLKGGIVGGLLSGRYTAAVDIEDADQPAAVKSGFDGNWTEGAMVVQIVEDKRPWFVDDPTCKPAKPGEHPRLFFRKADLPELKRRAQTPEGRIIMARLRQLLGGGEAVPAEFNPAEKAYAGNKYNAVPGSYTISHAAGFAFLYQMTGDRKYADLARKCVELAWQGRRDQDDRYAWKAPGGQLRAGPSLAWYAAAYDLGYDGFDNDFRQKFAERIQSYGQDDDETPTLGQMILTPRQGPNSNHYGAVVGGCGLAVLAIKGDPGTDDELLQRYDTVSQRNLVRNLTGGFGDHGFFYEGMGPGQISSDTAFVPYVQALRVAQGRDYTRPRPNAAYVTLIRVHELVGPPAVYPHRSSMANSYGTKDFYRHRAGLSRGGQVCQGFGAVRDEQKPALLWTYNHVIEPEPGKRNADTVSLYPHRPILALVNWPIGVDEKNPADVLPRVVRDDVYDYFVFRNRWKDAQDTVVTALLNTPNQGTKPRGVMVYGLGLQLEGPDLAQGEPDAFTPGQDGSGAIVSGQTALAVDCSGASGADVLVAVAGANGHFKNADKSEKARVQVLTVDGKPWTVLTLDADGKHPDLKADGNTLLAGKQKITFDGKTMTLAAFKPAKTD